MSAPTVHCPGHRADACAFERIACGSDRQGLRMDDAPSEATAYHEAGHAVVALALGRPVHRISILADRERLGTCEFGKPVFRPSEDWLEREALIALGGLAAEARFSGVYELVGATKDRRYVASLALQRTADARKAVRLERRLLSKTEHLLAQDANWRAVEGIAAELLRAGTISGRAARHLFDEARRRD
jgi:ATP-dependent Zn protease